MAYRDEFIIKNPYDIGGCTPDLTQIAYAIESEVKDMFPVNGVPPRYAEEIRNLRKLLEVAESNIHRVVNLLKKNGE